MIKAVVLLSGGMDSTATLHRAIRLHGKHAVMAVSFLYDSKHNNWEIAAAQKITHYYGVMHHFFDLKGLMDSFDSALLQKDQPVPEGYYEAENMRKTVVPGRNLIFLALAAGFAQSWKAPEVWIGVHSGDHFIYPDCRPDFLKGAAEALKAYNCELVNPFVNADKFAILQEPAIYDTGSHLTIPVPFQLTRTCYKNQAIACGKCGSCQERLDAFAKMGIPDPLEYESRELIPQSK